jgi:hypothetical protein
LILSSTLRKGEHFRRRTREFYKSGGESLVVKRRSVDLEETDSLLAAVLEKIQADQRKRDEELLAKPKVTIREKQRTQTARAQADALPASL